MKKDYGTEKRLFLNIMNGLISKYYIGNFRRKKLIKIETTTFKINGIYQNDSNMLANSNI